MAESASAARGIDRYSEQPANVQPEAPRAEVHSSLEPRPVPAEPNARIATREPPPVLRLLVELKIFARRALQRVFETMNVQDWANNVHLQKLYNVLVDLPDALQACGMAVIPLLKVISDKSAVISQAHDETDEEWLKASHEPIAHLYRRIDTVYGDLHKALSQVRFELKANF